MKIYRPVQSNRIAQEFHDNKACARVDADGNIAYPVQVFAKTGGSCGTGARGFYEAMGMLGHGGTDFATWLGEPVFHSVIADTLWETETDEDSAGGIGMDVFSKDLVALDILPDGSGNEARAFYTSHGGKMFVKFRYWHARENIAVGEVMSGGLIQRSGMSGGASGCHVHFGMKFVDEEGRTLDADNGYFGNVDSSPFFENKFILDIVGVKDTTKLSFAESLRKAFFCIT